MNYFSLRKDCAVAVVQTDERSIHATEWWNGEGIDFTFECHGKPKCPPKRIELHMDELADLFTIAIAMEFVDIDQCIADAEDMKSREKKHKQLILDFADKFRTLGS